ncbi:PRKCA-binding protein [Intoshia linei]|uniref:PRKCA-binding protein n=1 Tax=Intoshia linei TaxID=1819745 RepID=A0A177BBQ4_9BILA|nr:PRKCA-binding protein [Intoshia linei]
MSYDYEDYYEEDCLGMHITSGSVKLKKDEKNVIGISIGGGSPYCPCLYIVQIFDNSPASISTCLEAGDEIVGINSYRVKGWNKSEVARIIQMIEGEVTIYYNKVHVNLKEGKSFDIVLKNLKHRLIENMSSNTADALGLSRAILCNDSLVKKMDEMEEVSSQYNGLMHHTEKYLRSFYAVAVSHKDLGYIMSEIGNREIQPNARTAFSKFGDVHIDMSKLGFSHIKKSKMMITDLKTYVNKAIPDTKLTVKKYLQAKFEYLSYCLKIKEMDDESANFNAIREPLYRVETGNYEYRMILRCRQHARKVFSDKRNDVMVKLELLDQKHVQDTAAQLLKLVESIAKYNEGCVKNLKGTKLFPLEIDITRCSFSKSNSFTTKLADKDETQSNSDSMSSMEPLFDVIGEKQNYDSTTLIDTS